MWTVEECKRCYGSGWLYCHACEMLCNHDRLCPDCKGYNWLPVRVFGFELLAVQAWRPWELYRTRRDAFATIENDPLL